MILAIDEGKYSLGDDSFQAKAKNGFSSDDSSHTKSKEGWGILVIILFVSKGGSFM